MRSNNWTIRPMTGQWERRWEIVDEESDEALEGHFASFDAAKDYLEGYTIIALELPVRMRAYREQNPDFDADQLAMGFMQTLDFADHEALAPVHGKQGLVPWLAEQFAREEVTA